MVESGHGLNMLSVFSVASATSEHMFPMLGDIFRELTGQGENPWSTNDVTVL